MFKAHISGERIQSCNEHSKNTAELTAGVLKCIGMNNVGYICGLLHDVGKYTDDFNEYIEAAANGEHVIKGSIIHSFAGVRLVLERYHSKYNKRTNNGWENLTAEIIATAIGCHHGLFDGYDPNNNSGLCHRMEKQPQYDRYAISNFINECSSYRELDNLFAEASVEVANMANLIYKSYTDESNFMFCIGSLQRIITSALIDSDRKDTAEFMLNKPFSELSIDTDCVWKDALRNVENLIKEFPQSTDIDKARREMSDCCAAFAENKGAIYQLDLPTGAGKTLSSLRYALKHALIHRKARIIFAVPLLSVLDQNAEVIRDAIRNDDIILEHHSNIVQEDEQCEQNSFRDYLIDTWNSPIIITTLVQLMNTCFKGKTSSVRRFHSLCNSVVVIDEVQTVPEKMLSLFNMMINFLSEICGATVILCSATQPALELIDDHSLKISNEAIIPASKLTHYKDIFRRNEVKYEGLCNVGNIIDLIDFYSKKYSSVLVICNTKSQASELFKVLNNTYNNCFHLSTSMCMAHRRKTIAEIKHILEIKEPIICISTQLIEAGVDVSFGSVIRYTAGIDSIVQSAGRCNRHAEKDANSPVSVVSLNNEKLQHLKEIKRAQDATKELIAEFCKNPQNYDSNLISNKSIQYYYSRLYYQLNETKGYTEYSVNGHTLFDLLSINCAYCREKEAFTVRQAFKTAGIEFEVFDTDQVSVVVPYDDGENIIQDILSERAQNDFLYLKNVLNNAKVYSVNLFRYQFDNLMKDGAIYSDSINSIYILNENYYDSSLGIVNSKEMEGKEWNTLIL